jgi:hypothetical protein
MKHRLILIFVLLLGLPLVAKATDYYVSRLGSDSNNGTSASTPWATINHADAALSLGPGGTCTATGSYTSTAAVTAGGIGACVHVAPGTYSSAITTKKAGSASARIRYICDTQYGCTLNSSSGTIWGLYGAFTDVIGFDLDGTGHTGTTTGLVAFNQDILVQANRFHDVGAACNTANNMVAGSFFNTAAGHGNRYIGNLFYHNNCGVGHVSGVGNAQTAIGMDSYDVAQNNLIMDHGTGYAVQVSHGFPINGVYTCVNGTFTNNTVVNVDRGIIVGYCNNQLSGYTISNNIIANVQGGAGEAIRVHEDSGCDSTNRFQNNLVYGATAYLFETCPNNATGTQTGSNSTTFVNYTGTPSGDYRLKAGSTSIGNGVVFGAPPTDFAGLTRSDPYDIGSYKFGSETATSAPSPPTGLTALVQ